VSRSARSRRTVPDPNSNPNPKSPIPIPLYACLYRPPVLEQPAAPAATLASIAQEFSPRYECPRDDLVSIDVSGLARLLGPAQIIGEELRREAAARGVRAHVAVAGTRTAALVLAIARPGLTVIAAGEEAAALAPIHIGILEKIDDENGTPSTQSAQRTSDPKSFAAFAGLAFKKWGLKTLGELAALPPADLVSRMGRPALAWQAIARGEDVRPLVPMLDAERFESSLDLEWPIADLEPLSFVLTRLLEPLSTRLERRDRGVAVLHVLLRLVTHETCARRLELPSPMRDVRTLRTLALLDLESHPPAAAIDRVTIVIDPTPGRVLQHRLFTRAHPTPEQLSTLVARLGALMGQDRFGAPATVDSYRPGAFTMTPFATEHDKAVERKARKAREEDFSPSVAGSAGFAFQGEPLAISPAPCVVSAVRRCRQPVPARVAVADGRPVRVTTDRRGFAGGSVVSCAGPWRTSGEWWAGPVPPPWDRDEWDVSLSDGAIYRLFHNRDTDGWFIDAIVD
jgi:protein ImuB